MGCFSFLNGDCHVLELSADEFHIVSRKERIEELDKLSKLCGFNYTLDPELNTVNNFVLQDLIEQITSEINQIKPECVLLPYPSYNQDHIKVYEAGLIATRQHDINYFVKKVLVYEEIHSFMWDSTHSINGSFKPNYFKEVDIDLKLKGYSLLASQVRDHRSPESLEYLAKLEVFNHT